ncbi:MAG: pyridoxal-phosphate dependent enzyme, partial [Rhodothermales bacterium]
VEPEAGDDAARSFRSGTMQTVENPDTIADGARTPYLGKLTFPIVMASVDDIVTVSDAAIVDAMRFLWTRMKLVVEPTGALALAALFESRVDVATKRVGIVISGGNIDLVQACRLFTTGPEG